MAVQSKLDVKGAPITLSRQSASLNPRGPVIAIVTKELNLIALKFAITRFSDNSRRPVHPRKCGEPLYTSSAENWAYYAAPAVENWAYELMDRRLRQKLATR